MLAFALRWYYVSTTFVYAPLSGDASQYFIYAWNLAHHSVFSLSAPGAHTIVPDNYRDPGYPLFLAVWMKLLGHTQASYYAVLSSQALLGALTVGFCTELCRHWLSTRWAAAAGLLMAIWPHSIAINGFLLTETLSGFWCSLGMLLWAQACNDKRYGFALASGLFFGFAALTNAVLQPFGILLAALTAWRTPPLRKICLILALATAALPTAWAIRNAHLPSVDIHSSSRGRAMQNLVQGSWPAYHPAWRLSKIGDETAKANAKMILDAINREYELLLTAPLAGTGAIGQRLGQHPFAYLGWYLIEKPYELWGWDIEIGQGDIYPYPVANSPFQTDRVWILLAAICDTVNPLLLLLALACPFLAWCTPTSTVSQRISVECRPLMSVIGLVIFVTLVYTTLQAEPRYSIPFRSFEIVLAFTSVASLAARWKAYKDAKVDRITPKS